MQAYDFDFFVIGGGSGGVRASRVAASLGARVAVAEERYFGGTCVNVGCVPKKLMSYAAHFREDFEDSAGFGWQVTGATFNWETFKANKDKEINRLESIYQSILVSNKVRVFRDRALLAGPNRVTVADQTFSAKYILLATGGWPWVPEFPGCEYAITSNEIFMLEKLPGSMVIIGGGYIALEFATIFHSLGTRVTLAYRGEQLLRGFDNEIRNFITAEIGTQLDLRMNTDIEKIIKNNNNLTAVFDNGQEVEADLVLAATGRRPMTENLGLERVHIKLSPSGAIVVNKQFETGEPGIYAVGDVIDRVALTPVALAEGQLVARTLFDDVAVQMEYENIPSAVFCHPNLATTGMTEQDANEAGLDVDIYSATVKQLKHTLSGRQQMSMLKLVVNKSDDRVLGLHMVGPDAGELVQGFAVAMNCGATKADFDRTIGIHPTLAEEFVTMRTKRKIHVP